MAKILCDRENKHVYTLKYSQLSSLSSRVYGWFPQENTIVLHDFGVKLLYRLYFLYKENELGEEKRKKEKRKRAKKET